MSRKMWHVCVPNLRSLSRQICAVVLLCFLGALSCASAQDASHVYFAGVAYTSDAADITSTYPHISEALSADGTVRLDGDLHRLLSDQSLPLKISFDSLGSTSDEQKATALALAIDRESTSVERIGNTYKVRVEIGAQALFFNFKDKQILGGFPFTLEYIDARDTPPSDAYIKGLYQSLIFGASGRPSLESEFVKTIQRAHVPDASIRHLRVGKVTLSPRTIKYLARVAPNENITALKQQVAQEFGKFLATNQGISLLPYSSNQALGGSMPARFAEGDAYQLKIPDADYDIALNVAGFKKIARSSDAAATVYLYGAFVDVKVTEPLSGHVYFAQRMRQGASKIVPVSQKATDDWAASYETLLMLFNNFTKSISTPGAPWVHSAMPKGRDVEKQLSTLRELIKSCR
ncbi:hypothetical protein [Oleiagrimonas sp. MCCC 1A03011]|uniref:hypothetical protein n=1 Tax=Oleiagrimonas sp. MCCC 1A03011 TaxID=1926883 RepID=UPI0011BF1A29|nr:hypothetical protein [Oleiagrimonas sp. MCCC 1A03011]